MRKGHKQNPKLPTGEEPFPGLVQSYCVPATELPINKNGEDAGSHAVLLQHKVSWSPDEGDGEGLFICELNLL